MALRTHAVQLHVKTCFILLLGGLLEAAFEERGTMYMWIDANQARVLIGFEEDILIVSEGKMAPFTHDFRKAQQRMPAIPVNIQHVNFTWQATEQMIHGCMQRSYVNSMLKEQQGEVYGGKRERANSVPASVSFKDGRRGFRTKAEYFYEFQTLHSLDKDIMDDPTVNIPLLGSVPHKASVVQVGFPCRGDQDGVAAFEVTILVMDAGGNIILRTPHNAIFFKTCQRAKCPGGCRNGGYCNERQVCECQDGFYGIHCEKALCSPRCLNGGLCMSPGVCICPAGYFGPSCEKANCSTTCLNGGTCFHPGKCICAVGFEGLRCELSKFTSNESAFSVQKGNGGKCTGKNKCKCSKGYHGDLCSKAVCEPSCGAHGTCVEPNRCQCRDGWHGRHCNKRSRGGVSNSQRVSVTKHKSQPVVVKEAPRSSQLSETNYVV
ncbi:hypothetical protein DNTS_023488 [Danionella cerebrum]|uniref:Wnt inhibitory factor 1 n=1 Tax=Danionella cerebrum TaxID=2873325 RepID=A0A553MWH4_9TELE|nr:hypothetical protein DNTS_023488 [Danionella translucida]